MPLGKIKRWTAAQTRRDRLCEHGNAHRHAEVFAHHIRIERTLELQNPDLPSVICCSLLPGASTPAQFGVTGA
jgi:hypothetical protein